MYTSLSISEYFNSVFKEILPQKVYNSLGNIIACAVILIAGFWLSKMLGNILVRILKKHDVDESVHDFLRQMSVIFLRIIFVIVAMAQLGININSFLAALGAAGITAGLGLQNSISQFSSGIQILFCKPFCAGDYVEINNLSGKVEEIHFMYTTLTTYENNRVIVPNSNITSCNIINYNAQSTRRLDLTFSVSYDADIKAAKEVLRNVIEACPDILETPEPLIAVKEHAASSVVLLAQAWCSNDNYWKANYEIQEAVKLAFDANNISIPFNQLEVHIHENE